jgi:dolichol-phosphate mannosyltransferase
MSDIASLSKATFGIEAAPKFVNNLRSWDLQNWFGNPNKIRTLVGWLHLETFASGLDKTADWYKKTSNRSYLDPSFVAGSGAKAGRTKMLSVIVACYRDELAIEEMYTRLKSVLGNRELNYEIIFVNDCSPDNSLAVIQKISEDDSQVIGINHARNFGSQSAFLSGMSVALGDACVLMDGDLQDPPELIDEFLTKWGEGFEV